MPKLDAYFLPYQQAWLNDDSPVKFWEKTRRGGMTYVQAYEDVREALKGKWDVWFSSTDESAAREYIRYCEQWARLFKEAATAIGETIFDDERNAIQVYSIKFKSGKRITALSSNPSQFRSKGGKVVLDEFAFHKDQEALWQAAEPVTTWGYPLRVISTHNGKGSKFYKLIEEARSGNLKASVHRTDIVQAIEQGLLDRIMGRATSKEEREAWIEDKKRRIGAVNFAQEYLALPVDENVALFPYSLIESCEDPQTLYDDLAQLKQPFYVGMDIARRNNLTVIWVAEQLGARLQTRFVVALKNQKFAHQFYELEKFLRLPNCRRACLDQTGLGEQLTEQAQDRFGKYRVVGVRFTNQVKETLAFQLLRRMEDRDFIIPKLDVIRDDFHSIEKETTAAGNARLKANKNQSEDDSHADYFWASALCNHAAYNADSGEFVIASAKKPTSKPLLKLYEL